MLQSNQVPNRERAKRIIMEIVRQAGDGIGKTKLFKAFWLAHLYYAKEASGYLSDWPVVRMPNGPGIDKGDILLEELANANLIRQTHRPIGPFTEVACILALQELPDDLSAAAIRAVREAVEFVVPYTASALSELSHEMSRSWRETPDGQELSIYSDLIPDDVYAEQGRAARELNQAYDEMFK